MADASTDFDARAKTWDDDPIKTERARRVADAIAAGVPSLGGRRVLEYGRGTGLLGLALLPRVTHVTLADSSREMLAVAREKIAAAGVGNATTLDLDLASGPVPESRFDLVCTLMTLHHVPDTDGILHAFRTLLRPGGALCIADLDEEDGSFHGPAAQVHRGFDRKQLGRQLEACGFTRARFETVFEMVKQAPGGRRSYPVFLALADRP